MEDEEDSSSSGSSSSGGSSSSSSSSSSGGSSSGEEEEDPEGNSAGAAGAGSDHGAAAGRGEGSQFLVDTPEPEAARGREERGRANPAENLQQSLKMQLMDCLGIVVGEADHELLERVKIFQTLQKLLRSEGGVPSSSAHLGRASSAAAMKLVCLLAMQVATSGEDAQASDSDDYDATDEDQDGEDTEGEDPMPPGPPLVRARSGPATLGKDSVFLLIQSELRTLLEDAESRMLSRESAAVNSMTSSSLLAAFWDETSMLTKEMTSLLLSVSGSLACRHFLSRPPWIALYLRLFLWSPAPQARQAMCILRMLLPQCSPQDLDSAEAAAGEEGLEVPQNPWSIIGILRYRAVGIVGAGFGLGMGPSPGMSSPHRASEALILFLLDAIAWRWLDVKGLDGQDIMPEPAMELHHNASALSSEAVSALRCLLKRRGWAGLVTRLLEKALSRDSATPQRALAAAEVLGGHVPALYPGCRACVEDRSLGMTCQVISLTSASCADDTAEVRMDTSRQWVRLPSKSLAPCVPPIQADCVSPSLLRSLLSSMQHHCLEASPAQDEEGEGSFSATAALRWRLLRACHVLLSGVKSSISFVPFWEACVDGRLLALAGEQTSSDYAVSKAPQLEHLSTRMLAQWKLSFAAERADSAAAHQQASQEVPSDVVDENSPQPRPGGAEGEEEQGEEGADEDEDDDEDDDDDEVEDEEERLRLEQAIASMGFPLDWARRALRATCNDVEEALNWMLSNGDLLSMEAEAWARESSDLGADSSRNRASDQEQGGGASCSDAEGLPPALPDSIKWPCTFQCSSCDGSYVNLHADPRLDADCVGTLFAGENVLALGSCGDWLHVRLCDADLSPRDGDREMEGEDDVDAMEEDDEGDFDDEADEMGDEDIFLCASCGSAHPLVPMAWALRYDRSLQQVLLRPSALPHSSVALPRQSPAPRTLSCTVEVRRDPCARSFCMGELCKGTEVEVLEPSTPSSHGWVQMTSPLRGWVPSDCCSAPHTRTASQDRLEEEAPDAGLPAGLLRRKDRYFYRESGAGAVRGPPVYSGTWEDILHWSSSRASSLTNDVDQALFRLHARNLLSELVLRCKDNAGELWQIVQEKDMEKGSWQLCHFLQRLLVLDEDVGKNALAADLTLLVEPALASSESHAAMQFSKHLQASLLTALRTGLRELMQSRSGEGSLSDPRQVSWLRWIGDTLVTSSRGGLVPAVFGAWAECLRSASMGLKHVTCVVLSCLLHSVGADDNLSHMKACLDLLPLSRLEALALRRYVKESEDICSASRALQALLGLIAAARHIAGRLDPFPCDTDASMEAGRPCVACFTSPASAIMLRGRDLDPPWTAEFWVWRLRDAVPIGDTGTGTGSSAVESAEGPPQLEGLASYDGDNAASNVPIAFKGRRRQRSCRGGKDIEACDPPITERAAHPHISAEYLASSARGHIRLSMGGRLFRELGVGDEAQEEEDSVPGEAFCMSVGQTGEKDKAFDFVCPSGRWVHVALVSQRIAGVSSVELIVDGAPESSVDARLSLPMGAFGSMGPHLGGGGSFLGALGEVRYWRVARSASEVRSFMSKDVSGMEGLVGHWTMDEGEGCLVADRSGNCCGGLTTRIRWHACGEESHDSTLCGIKLPESPPPVAYRLRNRRAVLLDDCEEGETQEGSEEEPLSCDPEKALEMTGTFETQSDCSDIWGGNRAVQVFVLTWKALVGGSLMGRIEWPEVRVACSISGHLSSGNTKWSAKVGELLQGCPDSFGWVSGMLLEGEISPEEPCTISGSWTGEAARPYPPEEPMADTERTVNPEGESVVAAGASSEGMVGTADAHEGGASSTNSQDAGILDPPLRYSIVCRGGALIRTGPELNAEERGGIPGGTTVTVSERRFLEAEGVWRLRVSEPRSYDGWISEKDHICRREVSREQAEARALEAEISRRAAVRRKRSQAAAHAAATLKVPSLECKLQGVFRASTEVLFLLDRSTASPGLLVSPECTSVECEGGGARSMVLGSKGFQTGKHYWEVKVEACNWGSVFIGVAARGSHPWGGYGFLNYRATQAHGNETLYGAYYAAGDKVGVSLDMDGGTIAFVKDGEDFNQGRPMVIDMGIAYRRLRHQSPPSASSFAMMLGGGMPASIPSLLAEPLFPCFGLKCAGDRLSISGGKWISIPSPPPRQRLCKVLSAMSLAIDYSRGEDSLLQKHPGFRRSAEKRWVRMMDRVSLPVRARGGADVNVDVTQQTLDALLLREAGLPAGTISVGQGFTGPYGDGHIVGVHRGSVWFRMDADSDDGGAWYWHIAELLSLMDEGGLRPVASSPWPPTLGSSPRTSGRAPLDFDELTRGWSRLMDEGLVRAAEALGSRTGLPFEHLCPEDVGASAIRSAEVAGASAVSAGARFAMLLELSERVALTFPCCDLSLDGAVPLCRCDRAKARVSPYGSIIADMRGALLGHVKLALWNLVLRETSTFTLPNSDEYERPEDIPVIEIDRIRARGAQISGDALSPAARLSASVLGQILDATWSWEDASLRRSFAHMQDAGQTRCFFVKFRGEGVDDHGGPYRALFQTAIGEEPAQLGLLRPCPNGRSRFGPNQDQLLLDGEECFGASGTEELFYHVGRLLGVAVRHRIHLPLSLSLLVWKPLAGLPLQSSDLAGVDTLLARTVAQLRANRLPKEEMRELRAQLGVPRSVEDGALADAVEELFLTRHAHLIEALNSGLRAILPMEVLGLFTPREVEVLFCGAEVDVDLLQKMTEYEGGISPSDSHVKFFWQTLREMDPEQKSLFVNFCSGRSRLPRSAADFPMNFKITAPSGGALEHPDDYLPVAQTCFFSLSLPRYTTYQTCREKIVFAAQHSVFMDYDFLIRDHEAGGRSWAGLG